MKQKQRTLHANNAPKILSEDKSTVKINCDRTKRTFSLFSNTLFQFLSGTCHQILSLKYLGY